MKVKLFLSVACLSLILSVPAFAQPPEEHAKAAKKHLKTFEWDKALPHYKKIVKEHPHSPQAAEAHNQIGLDHKSHKRYDEAIEEYQKTIDKFPGTRSEEDAKTGIAAVYDLQGRYQEALEIYEEVLTETSDWDQIKYVSCGIRTMRAFLAWQKIVACGPSALRTILAEYNISSSQDEINKLVKSDKEEVTFASLAQASKKKGLEAYGLRLSLRELKRIEKPVIVLTEGKHYQVVTSVDKSKVTLIDQERGRYSLSKHAFKKIWEGYTLAFGKKDIANFKSARLSQEEMEEVRGGDCGCRPCRYAGLPGPNTELDNPDCNISVNTANGNITVTGPTITSSHSLGPSVIFESYYNSDDPYNGPLGHSWTHNYNVFLNVMPNGDVHIKREEGRVDIFIINEDGSYTPPKGIYDILIKNSDNTYTLNKKDKTIQNFSQEGRLTFIQDRNGNQVALTYDPNGLLIKITDASGRVTALSYNLQNRVERITDPAGRAINYLYDQAGRLISVTNPLGETTTYTYDSASYLISMTSSRGTTYFSYREGIESIINPLGQRRQYSVDYPNMHIYDENGNHTWYYSSRDFKTLFTRDHRENTTSFEYDINNNRVAIIDARGNRISYTYDERGNRLIQTDPLGNTTTYTYDDHNNLTSVTDPKGNTTYYAYDENNNLTSIPDPLGNTTFYTYDNNGLMTSMRDPKGNATYYEYDIYGNLIKVSEPQGRITEYSYDVIGNRISMTDPNGNITHYTHDSLDRLIQITNPDNTTIQYQYDCCNLIKKIDEKGQATSYEYDAMNRLTKVIDAKGNVTQYTYDNVGNRLSMTDAKGNTTIYTYDKVNHLREVIYPDGTDQYYVYDEVGNRITRTDIDNMVSYTYDANNRLIQVDSELGGSPAETKLNLWDKYVKDNDCITVSGIAYGIGGWHYKQHAIDGNINTRWWDEVGTGETAWWKIDLGHEYTITKFRIMSYVGGPGTAYIYTSTNGTDWTEREEWTPPYGDVWEDFLQDPYYKARYVKFQAQMGRNVKMEEFEIYVYLGPGAHISYTFDENGNRTSMTDDSGEAKYTYDKLNRLVEIDGPRANDTITYAYDQNGNLTGKTGTTTYTYDSLNRLIQVTSAEGRVTSYEYDLTGNRTRTTLPNGVDVYYSYDNRNRLLRLAGGPVEISYTYDEAGNRLTKDDGFYRDSYTYDPLNQLTKEEKTVLAKRMPPGLKELPKGFEKGKKKGFTEEGLPKGWEKGKKVGWPEVAVGESITTAYTYDPVGNRLSMDRNGVVTSYSYDVANKLLAAGDTTFSYDLNGNLTAKTGPTGTTNYTYDYENRLISAGGVSFAYDGDGNRISKGSTYYVNNVNLPLTQVLLEQDEAGNTLASYTYGLELISMTKGGATYYYIYDGLGNVVAITDGTGQTVQTYDYDAFGNVIATEGSLDNPYQFVGGYGCQDDGVGLVYMRARYYAPSIGRFISRDPRWGSAYDPQSLNRYLYTKNNPVNYIDPSGYKCYAVSTASVGVSLIGYYERGTMRAFNPVTCECYFFDYYCVGLGPIAGVSGQPEGGIVCGPENPEEWNSVSWGITGEFSSGIPGVSGGGQVTFGRGSIMGTAGPHVGLGLGGAVIRCRTWYVGPC